MDEKIMFEKIRKEVEKIFSSGKGSHDCEHTLRVLKLALHIGNKELCRDAKFCVSKNGYGVSRNESLEIIKYSALLHDIGRRDEDESQGKICHAKHGAKLAKNILEKYNFDKEKIEKIVHCIESHRFRGENIPKTKEAKILFDADKLDCIGAVGIGRAFLFAGEVGAKLHNDKNIDIEKTEPYSKEDTAYREFMVKLQKVKDRMLTKEGKRLAKKRNDFMVEFFERLNKEIEGEI